MGLELTDDLLDQIDKYLKGTLTKKELVSFQEQLNENDHLREEVILQKQLINTIGPDNWPSLQLDKDNEAFTNLKDKLRSPEYQEISKNLRTIEQNYAKENTPKKKTNYYQYMSIAAMIVVCLGIFYFLNTNTSLDSYYEDHVNWSNLPSFVEMGTTNDNAFSKGEIAFKNKNYKEASIYFEEVTPDYDLYAYSLINLGASYDLLDENKKAIAAFNKLTKIDSPESSKGYWYMALIYLKLNDKENFEKISEVILKAPNNYGYKEIQKIREAIK